MILLNVSKKVIHEKEAKVHLFVVNDTLSAQILVFQKMISMKRLNELVLLHLL